MRITVIGAGASGLFYAAQAASRGHEVILLESNEKAGKKLYLTGKGRCNVTNNSLVRECVNNVVRNPKFLYSCFSKWSPEDTIQFFESRGCPLKSERGNRVFPVSDKSSDIINCLLRECQNNHVEIRYHEKAVKVKKEENQFFVKTERGGVLSDVLVIATGGKSYPQTGSTGDGYAFGKAFGHQVVYPVAALCPIRIAEKPSRGMLELTLKNVELTAEKEEFKKTWFGDLEFLPNAITGPIALTMSSLINRLGEVSLHLDFKPALEEEKLDARIIREVAAQPNKDVRYLLSRMLPMDILDFFFRKCAIQEDLPLNSLTKSQRKELVSLLKRFPLSFEGLDSIEKGIVTSGGIVVDEIDAKTMESKRVEKLYFIGEVLDVDAFTGGFNLQIAFSTAYAAADALGYSDESFTPKSR
ncbi:MAG: NAD(P)/FAD-dependent oxidoreductase [Bacilli bacterium]|nr:NAD(P)/FAD-dependent oxidoreductase [Bacilli bacterium]